MRIAKLPLSAVPAEFRTAAPPVTDELTVDGIDVGIVGSFRPLNMFVMTGTVAEADTTGFGAAVVTDPTVIPPVEVRNALSAPVFPLTETRMPVMSNWLKDGVVTGGGPGTVVAAVNGMPVVGANAVPPLPNPITI